MEAEPQTLYGLILAMWDRIDDGWEFIALLLIGHMVVKDYKSHNGLRQTLNDINNTLGKIEGRIK